MKRSLLHYIRLASMSGILSGGVAQSLAAGAAASDTAAIHRGVIEQSTLYNHWIPGIYDNPGVKPYQWQYALSSFFGRWHKRDAQTAYHVQEGRKSDDRSLSARSYLPLSQRDFVWGRATYEHQYITESALTSVSDYALLYPHVVADDVRHNSHTERYEFGGGYGMKRSRWSWGLDGNFRAFYEYRKEDPRASDVVGDLVGKAGASYCLNARYSLFAGIYAGKYKQNADVKSFSGIGTNQLIQMGPAYYNNRFSDADVNVLYKGSTWGADAGLFAPRRNGAVLHLHYRHQKINRFVQDLTQLVPLTALYEHASGANAGWQQTLGRHRIAFQAEVSYIHRTGVERVLGERKGGVFPVVADFDQYYSERIHGMVSALYGYTARRGWGVEVAPFGGIRHFYEHTLLPDQQRKLNYFTLGGDLAARVHFRYRHLLLLQAHGEWMKNTGRLLMLKTGKLVIADFDKESKLGRILMADYKQQITDYFAWNISLQYSWACNDKLSFFLAGDYYTRMYAEPQSNWKYAVNAGINF